MDQKLLLLGLLRQQEMHGYQLYEFIEQNLSVCTDLKKPTAYYLLNKMARDGWISVEPGRQGNRPPRRVYRITPNGEAEYQRLLRKNLGEYHPAYFPDDIGLAFLDSLDAGEAAALLVRRRAALLNSLNTAQSAPLHSGSSQFVIEHHARHLQSEIEWLDTVLERLGFQVETALDSSLES